MKIIKFMKANQFFTFMIVFIIMLLIAKLGNDYEIKKDRQNFENQKIQVLVENQSNNLNTIGKNLEEQRQLREQIKLLDTKLKEKIKEVRSLENKNSKIRTEMIEEANNF